MAPFRFTQREPRSEPNTALQPFDIEWLCQHDSALSWTQSEVLRWSKQCCRSTSIRYGLLLMATLSIIGCGKSAVVPIEERSSKSYHSRGYYPPVIEQKRQKRQKPPPSSVVVSRARPAVIKRVELPQAEEIEWVEVTVPEPAAMERELMVPATSQPPPIQVLPDRADPLLGLVRKIERAMQASNYERAEGLLERALRIDPQRAGLWHDLAQVRFHQSSFKETVTLARRSNGLVSAGSVLRQENWSLIARAKEAVGDNEGAAAARREAR